MRRTLLLCACLVLAAGPASAIDGIRVITIGQPEPAGIRVINRNPPEQPGIRVIQVKRPGFTWTGFYVGAIGGYGWGKITSKSSTAVHMLDALGDPLNRVDGALFGGVAGYNFQMDSVVLGVEGDLAWTDMKDSYVTADPEARAKLRALGTVRARVGLALDNVMPFVTGGLAIGSVQLKGIDNIGFTRTSSTETHYGWVLGGGVEYALTNAISVKGEYNYIHLASKTHDLSGAVFFGKEDVVFKANVVKVGVNARF